MAASQKDIITLPNAHLRQRSVRIGYITEEIRNTVKDMADALLDWEAGRKHEVGVALAAVQIDRLQRIVIVRNDPDDKKDKNFVVFINPEIVKKEGKLLEDYEGCLSITDIYGKVPRYERVKVKATDLNGNDFRVTLEGFLARILQHEIDHTNGIVFADHIKENSKAFYRLESNGKLVQLDYDKDIKNSVLW